MEVFKDSFQTVNGLFWHKKFWLMGNVTWKDLENTSDDMYHPVVADLRYVILCCGLLLLARNVCERFIAYPIGLHFGIKESPYKTAPANPVLEKAFQTDKFPKNHALQMLSKQTDLSVRQLERWYRIRRNQNRPNMMKRFTEASWRFVFYFTVFTYTMVILWDKPWFADTKNCWIGYPHHHVPDSIFWVYMMEMGFYGTLLFSQFTDVQRKDFWEMFTHHVATILLLAFSWCGNFVRIGTLVLVVHDAVDIWLEAGKIAKYIRAEKLRDFLFAMFGTVWYITRVFIFPMKILKTVIFESRPILGYGAVYYTYTALLLTLQGLHIIWTVMITKGIIKTLFLQWEVGDIRSSDEENISENDEKTQHIVNNNQGVKAVS